MLFIGVAIILKRKKEYHSAKDEGENHSPSTYLCQMRSALPAGFLNPDTQILQISHDNISKANLVAHFANMMHGDDSDSSKTFPITIKFFTAAMSGPFLIQNRLISVSLSGPRVNSNGKRSPSHLQTPKYARHIKCTFLHFLTCVLRTDGPTDGRTKPLSESLVRD